MNFLKKIFGYKNEKNENVNPKPTEYLIDIDPNSSSFSKAFKDFYKNHFINAYGMARGDVDTNFFKTMTEDEKELAKRLVRQNLKLRQAHLFRASGLLQDNEALPILYEQFEKNTDFSWHMTIGQAIWKLNGDNLYPKLLRQLKNHSSETMRVAHFDQVTELKNEESIEMLFDYLNDESDLIISMTLSKLNYILAGQYEEKQKFDRNYFLSRKNDKEFKIELAEKLKNLLK
jgi:hypothetical protein